MTSLVKKVLRSGSSKKHKRDTLSPPTPTTPRHPPSPDLSELTSQEIVVLKEVFRRQEEFENEEIHRQAKLKEGLISFEESVKRQASQKSKLKHVDLRLCRLCYKTKFADGIGKACFDCHKRVCNKCGSFSSPKWNPKKHKCSKSRWRCNMCQMKREAVAKTGIWYHGNLGESTNPSARLRQKVWSSDIESSDAESYDPLTGPDRVVFHDSQPDEYHESESTDQYTARRMEYRKSRRRSITSKSSVDEPDDDELFIDNEEFLRERHMCRIQRHSKKWRHRLRSTTSLASSDRDTRDTEWGIERGTDSDFAKTSDRASATERDSSTDMWLSSDRDSNKFDGNCSRRNMYKHNRPAFLQSHIGNQYSQSDEMPGDGDPCYRERHEPKQVPFQTSNSTEGETMSLSREPPAAGSSHRHERLSDSERSYSDGIPRTLTHHTRQFNDKFPRLQRPSNRASSLNRLIKHDTFHNSDSSMLCPRWEYMDISVESPNGSRSLVHQTCKDKNDSDEKPSPRPFEHKLVQGSTNSLSPDRALSSKNGTRYQRQAHVISDRKTGRRSVSPKTSLAGQSTSSPVMDSTQHAKARRMTIPHCQNIEIVSAGGLRIDSTDTAKPHEILLHRDKEDTSQRTLGLGMRVVGGKSGPDGNIGAYVTMVTKGGPAATQGISLGDQVLEWNGRSMVDVTFEEAQTLIRQAGNIVQLTVIHVNTEVQQNASPMSQYRQQPIIVRSETLTDAFPDSPEKIGLRKPKRRMLPKTPLEIKREVKTISGTLLMQIDYDVKCHCLLVVLLRGSKIVTVGDGERAGPNPVAMVHLLPNRTRFDPKESEIKFDSSEPDWNETFVFPNITEDEIGDLSLEVTLWDYRPIEDDFLGEVLLDLGEAKIDNTPTYYQLEDHDDNSSPLPFRKKSFSMSESSAISPVTSFDASSTVASRNPSPRSSVSAKVMDRVLPVLPAFEKMKELANYGKFSPTIYLQIAACNMPEVVVGIPYDRSRSLNASNGRDKTDSSAQSTPLHSPQTPKDEAFPKFDSFRSRLKKKMRTIGKIPSSFALHNRKDSADSDVQLNRSHSLTDISPSRLLTAPDLKPPRRSFEQIGMRYDLLAPPHPLNQPNNTEEFFNEHDQDKDILKNNRPDRAEPDGDDVTSMLGPGQVAPKPTLETNVCGDIKVGFMVSKGQLEIDVIVVKGLIKSGLPCPPDTYVKTYLVEGSKTVQKKKTQTIRSSFDPIFRKKIKYSACNIHGRCIKINVWEKQKTFDKKQCLGEAVVTLDSLDLVQHTMEWYKLFPAGATDIGSIESLNFW